MAVLIVYFEKDASWQDLDRLKALIEKKKSVAEVEIVQEIFLGPERLVKIKEVAG